MFKIYNIRGTVYSYRKVFRYTSPTARVTYVDKWPDRTITAPLNKPLVTHINVMKDGVRVNSFLSVRAAREWTKKQ